MCTFYDIDWLSTGLIVIESSSLVPVGGYRSTDRQTPRDPDTRLLFVTGSNFSSRRN